jgi:hypothetical protein
MARNCGCAGASCGCKIISGGNGINVFGIGTQEDPYLLTADVGQLEGVIDFTDSSTVNFTVVGQGTPSDPMEVTATATITPPVRYVLPKVNQFIQPVARAASTSASAWSTGVVPGSPIDIGSSITIDALSTQVSTLEAATSGKILLYSSDAEGQPSTLVASAIVDASSTGQKTTTITPLTLQPGIYWVFIRSNSPGGLVRFTAITPGGPGAVTATAVGPITSFAITADVGTYAAPNATPTTLTYGASTQATYAALRRSA